MEMAFVGGMLIGVLVVFVLGLLFGGLVLKGCVRLLESFSPGYWRCVGVVFLAMVGSFVVNLVATLVMGGGLAAMADPAAAHADPMGMLAAMSGIWAVSLAAALLIYAALINLVLRKPDGTAIGFGRSLLSALLYMVAMMVITFVVAFVLAIFFGAGLAAMAGAGAGL